MRSSVASPRLGGIALGDGAARGRSRRPASNAKWERRRATRRRRDASLRALRCPPRSSPARRGSSDRTSSIDCARTAGPFARSCADPSPELTATAASSASTGDILDRESFRACRAWLRRDLPHRGRGHAERRMGGVSSPERRRNAQRDRRRASVGRAAPAPEQRGGVQTRATRDPARKVDEDTPLGPLPERAFYARSKRESEELVLEAHRDGRIWATAVRPDVIYGTRDRQFVPRIARLLNCGFAPVIGGGRSTLAIVHAANVADGAVLAAAHDAAGGRAYNLANDFDVTVRDFYLTRGRGTRTPRSTGADSVSRGARARSARRSACAKLVAGGRASVIIDRLDFDGDARQSVHVRSRASRAGVVAARAAGGRRSRCVSLVARAPRRTANSRTRKGRDVFVAPSRRHRMDRTNYGFFGAAFVVSILCGRCPSSCRCRARRPERAQGPSRASTYPWRHCQPSSMRKSRAQRRREPGAS